jgi:hypothetical protein
MYTESYKNKYLKYKYKYLKLKNQIGLGNGPFHTLVLGGGTSTLYGDGFFEVGGHSTSNYGANEDWKDSTFWYKLYHHLLTQNIKFKSIIIDEGSGSWFKDVSSDIIDFIAFLFKEIIYDEGIIMIEGEVDKRHNEKFIEQLYIILKSIGFKDIGVLRFGSPIDGNNKLILSLNNGNVLKDKHNIFEPTISIGRFDRTRGYVVNIDPSYTHVREPDQIEFIKNRIDMTYSP